MSQFMASIGPETSNGFAQSSIISCGMCVDIASILKLTTGAASNAVDFAVGDCFQFRNTQLPCQCVNSRVFQQLFPTVVNLTLGLLEGIVACVEKLEETPESVDILVWKLNESLQKTCKQIQYEEEKEEVTY